MAETKSASFEYRGQKLHSEKGKLGPTKTISFYLFHRLEGELNNQEENFPLDKSRYLQLNPAHRHTTKHAIGG